MYKIGQTFEKEYTPDAATWCMENRAYIKEIKPQDGVRRFQIVAVPEPSLSEIRSAALFRIDSATSAAILTGFEYEIETGEGKEVLHFSYLIEDQQNFSDTFNGIAMKKLMGFENLPETIDWNGWRNYNTNFKGELVVLTLTPDDFLNLYTQGALIHKQTHLEIGKRRKKAVENASSIEEINNLLKEWNI